jgi:hypothetical protein
MEREIREQRREKSEKREKRLGEESGRRAEGE